ncbi:AAA family ATPase [Delftia tsuruhatensis]|uniref:AAA family ATPase n=1 Tax=Delftia TaxID=80865 RepID=UPI00289B64B3|nr:AAA family ATPase [Delftia tsuruhatensis]
MFITKIKLKNWKNFRNLDLNLSEATYVLGSNAAGKSNFLDSIRFLKDISKPKGGGLQAALDDRGGISKVRCLHARNDNEVSLKVDISEEIDGPAVWTYELGFKPEGKGAQRILVSKESITKNGISLFERPTREDRKDPALLTQTYLEQIQTNAKFREVADFFGSVMYLHLVPQLLKYSERIGGHMLEEDPYGQGFLIRLAKTSEKVRSSRLKKIGEALRIAVPQFEELRFMKDSLGHPHLEARYAHFRPNAGWQREDQFSDGTLRLLALLWSLLEGNSLLLLEEPEISLNDGIVKSIPQMIEGLQRNRKSRRQIILSTHSDALLSNPGIDGRGVVLLESTKEGTIARELVKDEKAALKAGLSVAEVVLPKTRPSAISQLSLWK